MYSHGNISNSRTYPVDQELGFNALSTGFSGRQPLHRGLRFSGASRYFEGTNNPKSAPTVSPVASAPSTRPESSLRFLCLLLQQMAQEQESTDAALTALEQLGREVTELLGSLHTHFEDCPASAGIFDFAMLHRATLRDVDQWLRNHLAPLAASRGRTLMIAFDPRLDLLPTNVLFSLIVEHLRKRIYDSAPGNQMRLNARLKGNQVTVELLELGHELPPTPITDDATRLLWAQVVQMLGGSISWRVLTAEPRAGNLPGSMISITYQIQSMGVFRPPGSAKALDRFMPLPAA